MRPVRWRSLLLGVLLAGVACSKGSVQGGLPAPTGRVLSLQASKLAVLSAVGGRLSFCDPDVYPVAHIGDVENARARLPAIEKDRPAFQAILAKEHLSAGQRFTDAELVAIDQDYKQMQAMQLTPSGTGYRFSVLIPRPDREPGTLRLIGTVTGSGSVTIRRREAAGPPNCPICLAAGTLISTPDGRVPVQGIRPGVGVWTTDREGRLIRGVVLETGHMEAPPGHEVIRLGLEDGRTVEASPGHPTADGRTVGDLRVGDRFDQSVVTEAGPVPYRGNTWDLLPSGPTGTYFADGVLLGSTLAAAEVDAQETSGMPRTHPLR